MKMRRWIAIVAALMLLISMVPTTALAATSSTKDWCSMSLDGRHTWSNWTIRKQATCTEEGERYRTCRTCRFEQTEKIEKEKHSYGSWKTTKEPTCEKEGERVRRCKVCDHQDKQKIDKLPHKYGEWTVIQEATCTEAGQRTRECKVCGHVDKGTIKKLPHSFGEWEDITPATDHSSGVRARTCEMCGTQETEEYDPEGTLRRGDKGDDVKELQEGLICYGTLKGRADGSYGKGTERAVRAVQEAEGLEADGVAWPQVRAFAQHKFGEWQTISTLSRTTDGVRERTCERCGLVQRDVVEAKPLIKRGDRGKQVELIQSIIWDMGYNPGKIDGRFGPRLDAAIIEWARDHDWYYEPGLLKPVDIDRLVEGWAKLEVDRTGISGPDTPVNLQISVTPDFNMIFVSPGESLKYNYTVINLGTEDCTLGPLFLSFGEKQSYKADLSYLRYVGDLSGDTLKAGGANSYTGSFTVTADMDKAELWDPVNKHYGIQVNAWVLGTSKVDKRRWYSNIDWVVINLLSDEDSLDPNLVLTGKVLGDREWYTLGEEFEFEATLTNNTGKDLDVYITGVGRTQEGSAAITPEGESEPLPAGKSMTKTYSHTLSPEDEIKDGKFGFWLEASGFTESDEHVSAPQKSLWVEVHSPYDLHSDALVLTRESDDPEGTRYPAGETWRYRYRATNNGDVEFEDVKVKAYISNYGAWLPLGEAEAGTLAVGAHGDLEGERSVGLLNAIRRYDGQDENGKAKYSWGYTVDVIAEGATPDGEIVYAKPIRDWVPIDCEDPQASGYRCLNISGEIVDPKDIYVEGDEVEVELTVKNLSGETLTDYTIQPLLGPSELDDTYDYPGSVAGDGAIEAGQAHTQTVKVTLTRKWDTDRYGLLFEADGNTADGSPVTSNYIHFPMQILSKGKEKDGHSMPIPAGLAGKLRNGPVPRNLGDGEGLRSLVVVSKPTEEEYYYDGAVVPVQMRLTIDVYDEYDFMGIETGAGDYASTEPWMSETLLPGESYDFTYLMRLDPKQSGWSTRTVSVHLKGHMSGMDEYESCDVYPLFSNPTVTAVGVSNKSASLNLEVRKGEYQDMCGAGEQLDIPFNIQSGGNTRIDKVKLAWEQREGKAVVKTGEIFLMDSMAPGDSFDMSRKIQIVGITNVPYEPEYTLKLKLTGVFLNGKGKQETVESTPIELPVTVLEASEAETRLTLTGSAAPQKNAYGSGDTVKITLRAENHTGTTLEDVTIVPAWPYSLLKDELEEKGRFASLKDGEAAEVTLTYVVSPGDAKQGKIEMLFKAAGKRQDSRKTERSLNEAITLSFNDEPQQSLNLGAIVRDPRKLYAPGSKVTVELEWRNGPLTSARFYALADNSAPSAEYGNAWHSFGHGVKGYQFYEEKDVEAIMGWHKHEVTLQIPEDFEGDVYHAAWAIEGDWEDAGLHKLVRSNVDAVDLPIGIEAHNGDETLTISVYSSTGSVPEADINGPVVVKALMRYLGSTPPETYSVRYRPVGAEDWSIVSRTSHNCYNLNVDCPIWPHTENLSGDGWTYEFQAFDADRPELVSEPQTIFIKWTGAIVGNGDEGPDGLPGDEPAPDWADDGGDEGPDGLPGDEPAPDWADDGGDEGPDGLPGDEPAPDWADGGDEEPEEPGAPLEDVSLDINLLTTCPHPETGEWRDGDQVKFEVTADYNGGPKVPVRIEVCVTDAVETAEPVKVVYDTNTSHLSKPCEFKLDGSHKVNDQCVYDFVAYVYLDDEDHVDCQSETIPWIFDMEPGAKGPDLQPAPGGLPESGFSDGSGLKNYSNPTPLSPLEENPRGLRSLEIIEQTKKESAYYDGAEIPVKMRLTIDDYDDYDFKGIDVANGDRISDEPWMHGTLKRGETYDFTYTMVLDREKTGWATRNVKVNLQSRSLGTGEFEACEVSPPFVPAKVTIEDPNVHIINDNMSYLYLSIDKSKFKDYGYPGDVVNLPIRVSGDGNTTIKNVRLTVVEQLNGEDVFAWSGDVRNRMEPSEAFSAWHHIQIKGTQVGQPKGYKLVMYLTGTIVNRKGKQEEIRSLPVTVSFTVLDPSEGRRLLDMLCWVEPKKAGYAINDVVNIRCRVTNNYGEDLQLARVISLEDKEPFASMWKGHNSIGKLPAGESREIVIPYTIRAEDLDQKQLEGIFVGEAKTMQLEMIWTRNVVVKIPIMGQDLPEQLTATASCEMSNVKALQEVPMTLTVTNNADQRVIRTRVYAVGDNRDAETGTKDWHDCGHGVKGLRCAETAGIDPGESRTFSVPFVMPTSYTGRYRTAQWIVEGDLADGSGVVRSNITTVKLGVLKGDDVLVLSRTYTSPDKDAYEIGDDTTIQIRVKNLAGDIPEDLEVDLITQSHQDKPIHGDVTNMKGEAFASFNFSINKADVTDDLWEGTFVARAKGGEVESEPLPCTLQMVHVEPTFDIELKPVLATNSPHPDLYWYTGDKIKVLVKATYKGEGTLKHMAIQLTGPGSDTPVWFTEDFDVSQIDTEFEMTLDASQATDHDIQYHFLAWGCLEDPDVPDCFSDKQPMTFTHLYDNPEEAHGKPGSDSEDGGDKKETQINWAAITGFEEAVANGKNGGEAEASENGGEAEASDNGSEAEAFENGSEAEAFENGGEAEAFENGGEAEDAANAAAAVDGDEPADTKAHGSEAATEAKTEDGGETATEAKTGDGGEVATEAKTGDGGIAATEAKTGDSGIVAAEAKTGDGGETTETSDSKEIVDDATDKNETADDASDKNDTIDDATGKNETADDTADKNDTTDDTSDKSEIIDDTTDNTTDDTDGNDTPDETPDDGGETAEIPDEGEPVEFVAPDSCAIRVIGKADGATVYVIATCAEHRDIADQAAALIESAEGDKALLVAWEQAANLWNDALDAEYAAMLGEAGDDEKSLVLKEHVLFYAQLNARREALALEYPDDPVRPARWAANRLKDKTVELCALRHGTRTEGESESIEPIPAGAHCAATAEPSEAGETRTEALCAVHRATDAAANALLGGPAPEQAWPTIAQLWHANLYGDMNARRLVADEATRAAIDDEGEAFDAWLEGYAAFMNAMHPEAADEQIALAIRARVLDICAEAE